MAIFTRFFQKKAKPVLYRPLAHFKDNPWLWAAGIAIPILVATVLTHGALFGWYHIYDILFENKLVLPLWHHVPTWFRHDLRNSGEILLASATAQFAVYNAVKERKEHFKWLMAPLAWLEVHIPFLPNYGQMVKKGHRLSWLQWLLMIPVLLVYSVPGMAIASLAIHLGHSLVATSVALHHPVADVVSHVVATHTSLLHKWTTLWTSQYSYKVIGLVGSFFLMRRALRCYLQAFHYGIVRSWIKHFNRKVPWYVPMLPADRSLVHKLLVEGDTPAIAVA